MKDEGQSLRVVKDDANGVTSARSQAAHTVTHVDAIRSARALHRPVMDREHDAITAPERHDLGA
jgi:hypothetical protein